MLKTVRVTRYVTPLREGGSLPVIVEADDDGLYVLKFRRAGQGPLALVAELISGEIGRLLGLRVPELVFMELDACIGRNEPDPEIRDLLLSSVGLNLGLDCLPGASIFDPAAGDAADAETASKGVWFDAFITNIERTARNANLLWWHKQLCFIDHGASLYFHHNWTNVAAAAVKPFSAIKDHILLPWASRIELADRELRSRLDDLAVRKVVAAVPPEWLEDSDGLLRKVTWNTLRYASGVRVSSTTRCAHMVNSFDYALIRVVPLVDREEFFNAGVILFCPQRRYLSARVYLNKEKLKAFAPDLDAEEIRRRLEAIPKTCAGDTTAGSIAQLEQRARFHWLVAPRSTIVQVSPVHSGVCEDPEPVLERLFQEQVIGSGTS